MRQREHPRQNSIKACRSVATVVGHVVFQVISKAFQSDASADSSICAVCVPEPEYYQDLLLHCFHSNHLEYILHFTCRISLKGLTCLPQFWYSNIASE